jgi:peptidoglycan/xylan/chitin deacetylase (PgdA/CDA1 family)/glycosyltransferase involved in cell wall biosynthesis
MRVSVIVPAYNEEETLQLTLDSLRKQDFTGTMEIIVVDNDSTDGTAKVANDWGVRVVRESRKGYVYALMCGFDHACGEILITTDADTIVPPNWISTLVGAFEADAAVVAAGGMVEFCDSNWKGKIFARCILPAALAYDRICFSYPHLWGASMAVKREAFLLAGGWTGKFNLQADTELSRRLAAVGKVVMIDSLKVSTSARRFNHGLLANLFVFGINFLSLQLFHRPAFFDFTAIRTRAAHAKAGGTVRRRRSPLINPIALALVLSSLFAPSRAWPADPSTRNYISRVRVQEKVIALTFDDGPNEPYTSQVLKILHENDVRATFFLIGENVQVFPDAARKIAIEGHAIGNHSYSHPLLLALQSPRYQGRQIDRSAQIIEAVTGVRCTLFRPPHGFHSSWLLSAVAARGLTAVGWSENASDWHKVAGPEIAARIVKRARPGNIILLHDGLNRAHGVDRSRTVSSLQAIITNLRAQGYRFVTVPELFKIAGIQPPQGVGAGTPDLPVSNRQPKSAER